MRESYQPFPRLHALVDLVCQHCSALLTSTPLACGLPAFHLQASAWPTCRTLPYVRPPRDAVYVCDAMTQTDPFPDAGIAGQTRPEEAAAAAAAAAAATAREKISV